MLRVIGLNERSGAYYLADLAAEVTAAEVVGTRPSRSGGPPDLPGRWVGAGAEGLGLEGAVDPGALGAALSGRRPFDGRPLRRSATTVSGFDLTFAAPKSVSVLFGTGDPGAAAEVVAAHQAAVVAALGYVERRALGVRRGTGDERRVEPGDGLVAATFTHGVSRALDPHLHTHVVVANLAHGADGRWTALDGRGLFAHAGAAGALYDAHLRFELGTRLGARWSLRRSGSYELATADPAVLGAFSARRAEISGHLHARGGRAAVGGMTQPSARQRAVAWAVTRDDKALVLDELELRRLWGERLEALGLTRPAIARSPAAPTPRTDGRGSGRVAEVAEHAFAASLSTLTRAPARRDAVAAWAGALETGAPAAAIEGCVEMLAPWGPGTGVGEPPLFGAPLVPRPYLLGALGPRPADPTALGAWHQAAGAIDRYRARWMPDGPGRALGPDDPSARARMPARQLAEHLAVARTVADTRRLLGRPIEREPRSAERALAR